MGCAFLRLEITTESMDYWKQFKKLQAARRGGRTPLSWPPPPARLAASLCPGERLAPTNIGIDHGPNFLRVQVKSTTCRTGTGYFCQFKPHYLKKQDYTLAQLDLFAAYVIPVATWYIIPAALLLGAERKNRHHALPPFEPLKKDRYSYEAYKRSPGRYSTKAGGRLAERIKHR